VAGFPETAIRIENLNVAYDGRQVLNDITADIPENRITAIIGPSGCGKTTLLKTLNRLIDSADGASFSGSVLFEGMNILQTDIDVNDVRKKIGFIAQTPTPLPMSIYENVAYGPKVHGTNDRKTLDSTVERCMRAAGLWDELKDRLSDPASKLSVGQQQRLCLSRALAVEPKVLLCDEPTSALDPISSRHIEEQLLALKKEYTIVLVTHTLRQARRLADYVLFVYFGHLVEQGSAEQTFNNPTDPRTKAYIDGVFG
jgi:phosphate transport system ATP-binding protein